MEQHVWKHLPYAVYLDTNGLRAAGRFLNQEWINELLSITNKYGISLCISRLVLEEYSEYIMDVITGNRQKLQTSIGLLKDFGILSPELENIEIRLPQKPQLNEMLIQKLEKAGFRIIENWDGPLSQLLGEAVEKRPPFERGGKGLCDAVILESYAQHSKDTFGEAKVLVVSNDGAVRQSHERFDRQGIAVEFLSESDVVEKLKSLLSDEIAAIIAAKEQKLKDYITKFESQIIEFVKKAPLTISGWMLNNPLSSEEETTYGSIERILSVKPTKITKVVGGAPIYGEEVPEDRYPVLIYVEIELKVIVRDYGLDLLFGPRAVVKPESVSPDFPVSLDNYSNRPPRRSLSRLNRNTTVLVTLDAEKERDNILQDFRIEKLI